MYAGMLSSGLSLTLLFLLGSLVLKQKVKFPFRAPSLIDKSRPYFSGIKRFGISKFGTYYQE